MSFWWLDRTLPGVVASLIISVLVWVSHARLRKHITKTADRQTAALSASPSQDPGGTRMAAEAEPSTKPGPHFGLTRHGLAVHLHTTGHLAPAPGDSWYARFNKRTARLLADKVGTMTCFWIFNLLSFALLAPTLSYDGLFGAPKTGFLHWYLSYGFIILWTFLLSTYIQLVLLPGLMVGQALQNIAADARAAKTFEDVERVVDLLRLDTEGGLKDLYDKLHADLTAKKGAAR